MQFKYVMVYLDEHQMKHLIIMDATLTLDITTLRMNSFAYIVETTSDKKKPKMPNQACANGLGLDDMPKDLHDISPLERRIISLRIPFITHIVMCRYGSHYKMNGPPVNVPTTLDHVIKKLPHMPQQL